MSTRNTAVLSAVMIAIAVPGLLSLRPGTLAAEAVPAPAAAATPALTATYYYIPG